MNEAPRSKCKHDWDGGDFMSTQEGEKVTAIMPCALD